jgi:hypothetical protein
MSPGVGEESSGARARSGGAPLALPGARRRDDPATTAAIGLLAYASADVAHHLLGHGGACLALGGRIVSLSSVFVACTVRGTAVDLAGPFANLAVGLSALTAASCVSRGTPSTTLLFLALAAGFNLLWFGLQLSFSAATGIDDWAWTLSAAQAGTTVRLALVALGGLGSLLAVRAVARRMAAFARPEARARRLVLTAWLTAGAFACVTALFDSAPLAAILRHAAPQSFLLSIGLLLVPAFAARSPASAVAPAHAFSATWVLAAVVVAAASIVFLGRRLAV